MLSIPFRPRRPISAIAPALALAAAFSAPAAFAADRPATPEGAAEIKALIARFFPSAQTGASPLVTVSVEGAQYVISASLTALNSVLAQTGAAYEPATIVYKAVEQDDGRWRVTQDSLPKIAFHSKEANATLELANFQSQAIIDPAIAWLLSGQASADKGTFHLQSPKVDESVDFGPLKENAATTANADGSVSTLIKQDVADVNLRVQTAGAEAAPMNVSGRIDKALISIGVDNLKSRKAFDLWALVAANPARADLAKHGDEVKGLLKELVAPGLKLSEGVEAQKVLVASSIGAVTLANFKYDVGAANLGPQSAVSLNVSADGLSLPAGLVPLAAGALTPSRVDVAATFKGLDFTAGANEAIGRLKFEGDGPLISDEDADKVEAALLSAGPVRIEFAPSHIVAPAIDADFAGTLRYEGGKALASITVHMRDFDKTMAAVNALGPDIMGKAMPVLALAKGLGKSEGNGALSWQVELGADRTMKVNGIPFGKAPD